MSMPTWKKKGFSSRYEYLNSLAKEKGFKSHSDYQNSLYAKRGFGSYTGYLNSLAKEKGFKSHSDYQNSLIKEKGFRSWRDYYMRNVISKSLSRIVSENSDKESIFSDIDFVREISGCDVVDYSKELKDKKNMRRDI